MLRFPSRETVARSDVDSQALSAAPLDPLNHLHQAMLPHGCSQLLTVHNGGQNMILVPNAG